MAQLYVCGLDAMPVHVRRLRPSCLVSLLPAHDQPPTPRSIRPDHHLRLELLDFDCPGLGGPERAHVEALIEFLRARPRASVLFHCMAGISRSTAAALVAMTLEWPGREREAVSLMRQRAPHAYPNRLLLEHADAILGRGGCLVAARDAMDGADFEAEPTLITLPRWIAPDDGSSTVPMPALRMRRPRVA